MMDDHQMRSAYQRSGARQPPGPGCLSPEALDQLARRDAPEATLVTGLDHVMACPRCLGEFEPLRAIHAAARADQPARTFTRRATTWLAAAVVLIGLGMATLPRLFQRLGPSPDPTRGADSVVVLIEPLATVPSGAPLRFAWHPVADALSYDVEVLSDTDEVVTGATVSDTVWSLPDSVGLVPGASYRWLVAATTSAGAEIRAVPQRFTVRAP